jgi:membrane protease YdiL (CAAX protease family)
LVFAGFHLFGLSGDLLRGALLIVPTFLVMGVILAWVTVRRERLGPAIFIHSGFNLLALLILLMPPELIDQLIDRQ